MSSLPLFFGERLIAGKEGSLGSRRFQMRRHSLPLHYRKRGLAGKQAVSDDKTLHTVDQKEKRAR
eukprot:2299766-Prymnesium_polylepis.1